MHYGVNAVTTGPVDQISPDFGEGTKEPLRREISHPDYLRDSRSKLRITSTWKKYVTASCYGQLRIWTTKSGREVCLKP